MATRIDTHPSADALREFAVGEMDESVALAVMSHLDVCADCCRAVAAISGDDFLERIRQARRPSITPNRTESWSRSAQASTSASAVVNLPQELASNPQYEILREIGRGGMGVVYLAKNTLMDRLEVLKIINKALLKHPGAVERFLREIRSAAKLNHANVVTAYSAVQAGEILAFAMEYVEGENLDKVVQRQGPLPVVNACYYAQQAALGLQHAFERNMVHRDIKPQNLMLTRVGKKHIVKILDFGLAKVTRAENGDTGLTDDGAMMGTPDYVAPEQTLDAASADIRADVYSLGCTLYYLLSGGPPFRGRSTYEVLQMHQTREARPLNLVRAQITEELAAVVRKTMAKNPAERYQTPMALAQALAPHIKAGAKERTATHSVPEMPASTSSVSSTTKPPTPDNKATMPMAAETLPESRTKSRGPRKDRNRRPPESPWKRNALIAGGIAVSVALVALLGWFAGSVFRVKTPEGTLVVDVNVPNPEVYVDGRKMTVRWDKGGKKAEIRVRAGTREVVLTKDGFEAFGERVALSAGQSHLLTARLEKEGEPGRDEATPPPIPPSPEPGDQAVGRPEPLDCTGPDGASADVVRNAQVTWAKYLGRDVETTVEIANGVTMTFVLVPPGKYRMGSPPDEKGKNGRYPNETLHEVMLTEPFDLGKYEVTQAQYEALTGQKPSFYKGPDRPVEQVTWTEADRYGRDLTKKRSDRHVYRLATEAEWEYACRGGRPVSLPFGVGDGRSLTARDANFNNLVRETSKVGSYAPNALGLCDMHGNVWEWCADWNQAYPAGPVTNPLCTTAGEFRVARGGCHNEPAPECRSALRQGSPESRRDCWMGFRLARSIPAPDRSFKLMQLSPSGESKIQPIPGPPPAPEPGKPEPKIAAPPPAPESEKPAAKTPATLWKEGSVWAGTGEQNPGGRFDIKITILKRDGDAFVGRYDVFGGDNSLLIQGIVRPNGAVAWRFTRVLKLKLAAANLEGARFQGMISGDTANVPYMWANHPAPGQITPGKLELKLQRE